ncbi:esterase/lipase family protein [Pendulispora albinea]|uniref:Alpha/beta fold hydrolase n=1 Tax=Pendulispora albinea TaxID=2741071 RepID=A0ABZ2LML8_9BACT
MLPNLPKNPLENISNPPENIPNPMLSLEKGLSPLMKFQQAFIESCFTPDRLPPGAQDPFAETRESMRKPPNGTNPVVLVHGTWANRYNTWKTLAPELKNAGFSVSALNYGEKGNLPKVCKGYTDIRESAKELAKFVDEVLQKTGASKVDMIGHSQGGGILPRWYLKYEGGKEKVDKLIGLAPSNHGLTATGLGTLANMIATLLRIQALANEAVILSAGIACLQQSLESTENLNPKLDDGGDTFGGVKYIALSTWRDEVVTPWQNGHLKGADGHTFTNLTLQEYQGFKYDLTEHNGMPNHPVSIEVVKRALVGKPVDPQNLIVQRPPFMLTP